MSLDIDTRNREHKILPNGKMITTRQKHETEIAVEIADEVVKRTVNATGRCATLVKELSEAEAVLELMEHKFKASYINIQDEAEKWLREVRQTRFATEAEFKGIAKTLADITDYFGRPEIVEAMVRLKDFMEAASKIRELHDDPKTQKLIEALMRI